MSARNKLENKRDRKADRKHDKATPKLHPNAPVDSIERLTRQLKAAPLESVVRLRRRAVVRAAGLSNALRRAQRDGLVAVFRNKLRQAYAWQCERALVANAEVERRVEKCKSPLRSCVPHKKRGYQNPNGN